ncbi:MAG: hypothetical protein FJW27_09435 [Acidimicrobiia bacterium]|nr:hypothetical protein [Acidimicrobiia bacterium]
MKQTMVLPLSAALAFVAGGLLISAQQIPTGGPVMSSPLRESGTSVTPAYEGWFDNADGTHNFLIGYYNRNTKEEIDVPIGPNNRFDTKEDMGQPTHFLTRRRYGYFTVTVPREFTKTQKISWTLTVNGVTSTIPFQMRTDYNISPLKASEESPNRGFNVPPKIRFAEPASSPTNFGPLANGLKPLVERKATVGQPMALDMFVEDDALYASGTSAPVRPDEELLKLEVTKFRGPGMVTLKEEPKVVFNKGGKPMQDSAGKATAQVLFSTPGEYLLHVHVVDYSGKGGGGTGCCWGTAVVRVNVAAGAGTTGGQ